MPLRVLIVDDHAAFRASARALFEACGFAVVAEAADVAGALAATRALRPEVVLLDVQLPDGDGITLAHELQASSEAPRIILTSSRTADEYGSLIAASGAQAFITKSELSGPALDSALR